MLQSKIIVHDIRFIKRDLNGPDFLDGENLKNEYLKLKDENEKLKKRIDELNKEVFFKNYFSLNDKKMIKGEYLNINNLIL